MNKLGEKFLSINTEFYERITTIGRKKVPVNYYTMHNNWGDQLNKYLIEKITNKVVVKNNFKCFKHLLAIGSVLSSASEKSIVWGSGFISNDAVLKTGNLDIRAVRGTYTREKLLNEFAINCPDVLGDPAILLPLYYMPENIQKKHRIGIIPHYKDKELPAVKKLLESGCVLVDIQLDIENFIDQLNQCDYIISSSLHGLIAADTYAVPNKWVSFSDNILGGKFKFLDYYSTTNNNDADVLVINDFYDSLLPTIINTCKVSEYVRDKNLLLDAFPNEFL